MITKREEINTAQSPYIIDKKLFTEIAKGDLLKLAEKFTKSFIMLNDEQMEQFKKAYEISEVRRRVGKMGGRPRIPDLTEEQIAALPKEEKHRYMMRIWKRNSRNRSKNAETTS